MKGNQSLLSGAAICLAAIFYIRRQQLGSNREKERQQRLSIAVKSDFSVVICGAGISGICTAIKLKEAGIPFTIYESLNEVGGTWAKNLYPGAACDIPINLYSFSFAPKSDWNQKWETQAEILKYYKSICEEYGLYKHIVFNTSIQGCTFDTSTDIWTIDLLNTATNKASQVCSRVLVAATGQLNVPHYAEIPNSENFKGVKLHTAEWDANVDFAGKTVACIGTGASATQCCPEVAKLCDKLYIFQRSANYYVEKANYRFWRIVQIAFYFMPTLNRLFRLYIWCTMEFIFRIAFRNRGDTRGNRFFKYAVTWAMRRDCKGDKQLEEKVIPKSVFGCKRMLLSSDWVPMMTQKHVELITDPILELTEDGVACRSREYNNIDLIIYGTGFKTQEFMGTLPISNGRQTLLQHWDGTPSAFYGVLVPEFPNLFMLYGPNTNLGHNSIIFMIECQVEYSVKLISKMVDDKLTSVQVKSEICEEYNRQTVQALNDTVFQTDCSSWYKNKDGTNTNNWSSTCWDYYQATKTINYTDYIFKASTATSQAGRL